MTHFSGLRCGKILLLWFGLSTFSSCVNINQTIIILPNPIKNQGLIPHAKLSYMKSHLLKVHYKVLIIESISFYGKR